MRGKIITNATLTLSAISIVYMFSSNSVSSSSRKSKSTAHINYNQQSTNGNDPLKYCHAATLHTSALIGLEYNNYINKLVALGLDKSAVAGAASQCAASKSNSTLLSEYVYLDTNSKWKKGISVPPPLSPTHTSVIHMFTCILITVWLCLRMDEKQQEAKLDIYQSKSNLKPFDTINLVSDRIQIESNMKQIRKLASSTHNQQQQHLAVYQNPTEVVASAAASNGADNIYEEVSDDLVNAGANGAAESTLPNFETSSLVLLLYNTAAAATSATSTAVSSSNKLMLKIGFTSFNSKNIW